MELKPVTTQSDGFNSADNQILSVPSQKAVADSIKGTVLADDSGKPLIGVKIRNKRFKNVIAITDKNGKFSFSHNGEITETIVFELSGYASVEKIIATDAVIKMLPVRIMVGAVATISHNTEPLYVINSGNKSCFADDLQSKNILPEWIEKIDVINGASATAIYGLKGANGVVIVKIKKKYANKIDFSKKK